jgi:predicted peptidase
MAIEIMQHVIAEYPVDRKRIFVNGQSMGGFAPWDIICRFPELFAAAVPVCGGGDPALAERIFRIPVWAFHGRLDTAVKAESSGMMIEALKQAGGNPLYTEYPAVGHDAWNYCYKEPGLFKWLFAQSRI